MYAQLPYTRIFPKDTEEFRRNHAVFGRMLEALPHDSEAFRGMCKKFFESYEYIGGGGAAGRNGGIRRCAEHVA